MKPLYICLALFLVSSGIVLAQPQFQKQHCFQVGDSTGIGFANVLESFESIVPLTGPNYTWNFSNGTIPGPWTTWTDPTTPYVFQPGSEGLATSLQGSEINEYAAVFTGVDNYFTYSSDNDTLYYEGINVNGTAYPANPRFPYLSFPMNYEDSVYIHQQLFNPIQPLTPIGSVTRYWIYDGFGTLVLPYGSSTNVYRVRTRQIDSTYIINMGTVYDQLIWFRQSDGIPVLRFLKNGSFIAAYYTDAEQPAMIVENVHASITRVYPVPFKEKISVMADPSLKITHYMVRDMDGKIIEKGNYADQIDIQMLSSGTYFLELRTNERLIDRHKIIKE